MCVKRRAARLFPSAAACYTRAMKRPPLLIVLAVLTMVAGGFRACSSLNELTTFTLPRDTFVKLYREQAESVPATQLMPPSAREKLGEQAGEQAWARRGVAIPLGVVNLVLGFLLFFGAMRALAGSHWGHGAWEWAARLSVPYVVVSTAMQLVVLRDAASQVTAVMREMGMGPPATSAMTDMVGTMIQFAVVIGGLLALALYVTCWVYLRRQEIRALYPAPAATEE